LERGESLVGRNLKTPFAEVDLLLKSKKEFWLAEVKTAPRLFFESARVSPRQSARLKRAYHYLSKRYAPLRTVLVWVKPSGEIQLHFDFLSL
jgi:Holliday junction resolvase-like predicted endonuclease